MSILTARSRFEKRNDFRGQTPRPVFCPCGNPRHNTPITLYCTFCAQDGVPEGSVLVKKAVRNGLREQLLLWTNGEKVLIIQRQWQDFRLHKVEEGCEIHATRHPQTVEDIFDTRVVDENWTLVDTLPAQEELFRPTAT